MTYVVTQDCIKCKYTDCVEVCPVDCFYEGEEMLVINPDECIDCGVCEPECPADAIIADTDPLYTQRLYDINAKWSGQWEVIVDQKEPLPGADDINPAKGYTDDKFGTEEHFGEEIIAHTLSSDALSADNPLGMKMKQRLEVEVVDEKLHSIFTHSDAFVQYAKLKYDYTTRTMQIMPFTVAERDDEYASIDKIFNNLVGKAVKKASEKVWNNYIKLCDKRDKRLKADKAKKDKEMIEELNKFAPL